jgi:iron complex outermembrane receptor protein
MMQFGMPWSLALLTFCITSVSIAQEQDNIFTLGEVEVTATHKDPINQGAVRFLGQEEMHLRQQETVGQALDLLPGVNVSNFGARNEQTVYIRGFDLRQVPIFVDGIPIYVPYDGYVDLGRFTTFDLSKIEVSKGFSSVLYGPNTLGGAINLVTQKPRKPLEGDVGGGISFDKEGQQGYRSYLDMGSRQESWYIQSNVSYLDEDYFSVADDFVPTAVEDGGKRDNSYRRDQKFNLKVAYTPNASDEYSLNYINQQAKKGTPPYAGKDNSIKPRFWQWPYWDKESLYYISNTTLGNGAVLKGRLYYDTFKNSLFSYDDPTYTTQVKPYAFKSSYDDYSYGGNVELGLPTFRDNALKFSLFFKDDVHREQTTGVPLLQFKDRTYSLAVEDNTRWSPSLTMVTGVSYDHRQSLEAEDYNSQTQTVSDFARMKKSAWNPQVGWFYALSKRDTLRLTLAHKTRFPTIKDRYSYRLGTATPNPDLKPEYANHLEIGYSGFPEASTYVNTSLFYSKVTDLIQSVNLTPNLYQLQNIAKVTDRGFELDIRHYSLEPVEIGANYTLLQRKNNSDSNIFLTDTPRHKLVAYANWNINSAWLTTANVEYNSKRYSSTDGKRIANSFHVVNLQSTYRLKQTELGIGCTNLLDEYYEYSEGYPERGRLYSLWLKYQF